MNYIGTYVPFQVVFGKNDMMQVTPPEAWPPTPRFPANGIPFSYSFIISGFQTSLIQT
nr:MAG TPA: hypothetical protein [Caudoviricetes sp.]